MITAVDRGLRPMLVFISCMWSIKVIYSNGCMLVWLFVSECGTQYLLMQWLDQCIYKIKLHILYIYPSLLYGENNDSSYFFRRFGTKYLH